MAVDGSKRPFCGHRVSTANTRTGQRYRSRRFMREALSAQDADNAPRAGSGGQPTVRRDRLALQPLGQGHVTGVVGADVGAQLEGAPHQSQRWDALEPQLLQMPDGGPETLVGQRARQSALAEHRHGLDVDQIRRGDLVELSLSSNGQWQTDIASLCRQLRAQGLTAVPATTLVRAVHKS